MKGIVFAEFLEMVETDFGYVVADEIASRAATHSQGVYSGVDNYPHGDLIAMIERLSETVGLEKGDLVKSFGRYLFRAFTRNNKSFFEGVDDAYEFLNGIETVIHTEVRRCETTGLRLRSYRRQPDGFALPFVASVCGSS